MKKYFHSMLIGVAFASIYPIFIALFSGSSDVIITARGNGILDVVLQLILCGLFGPVSLLLSKLTFENSKLSLLAQTILHFLGLAIYFVIVGFVNKWFVNISNILWPAVGFAVIYICIYLLSYFSIKKEVAEANRVLINKK